MKLSHRTLVVLAATLLLLPALGIGSARPDEDKAKEEAASSWTLATDAHAAMQLQAAADYIQDEDWRSALRLLQHLLDGEPDTLARLAGRDGKAERTVSVHAEAERLLASLPEAGRRAYQQTYGPRAADLLEVARTVPNDELFARVVERYLYTDAGLTALRELARRNYKDGRLTLAALSYARLLEHVGPARWTNEDLYQAVVAFHHCGTSAPTDQMLKRLRARNGQNIVGLGKRKFSVEELRKEIERAAPLPKPLKWPIYRGDVARINRGVGEPPLLEALWRQSMFYGRDSAENAAKERVRRAEKKLQEGQEPIIPAFSPIALTARNHRGERKPLLIYKNYFGVTTVDLRNGSLAWLSPSSWSLQRLLDSKNGYKQQAVDDWLNYYQGRHPQILFENSTVGTLSTDGEFVYVVEDLAVPPPSQEFLNPPLNKPLLDKDLEDAVSHNRLFALSLARSGALVWVLGENEKDPLRDHYFLGPPLPLDGLLYLLIQKKQQVSLLCLDPHVRKGRITHPRIVFKKPLVEIATSLREDPIRRTRAAHLAYGEGILVCPTNAGVVLGVDLLTKRLAWVHPYPHKDEIVQDRPAAVTPNHDLWKATAPVIAEGKVVLAPPDDRSLYCLNLADGALLWSRKKGRDDVYLAGVYGGKVLIVGTKSMHALSLATGEVLWTQETGLPSGQGIAAGDVYYLPLQRGLQSKQPEILVLDIAKGGVIGHNKTRLRTSGSKDFEVPGNLVFVEGKLISQSPWEIIAYPPLKDKLKEANEGVEQHPGDPARLLERAVLRLNTGEQREAIEDLRAALSWSPSSSISWTAARVSFVPAVRADPQTGIVEYLSPKLKIVCQPLRR